MVVREIFEKKCTVARLRARAKLLPGPGAFGIGFDHGLPCRVNNMARGTRKTKTEAGARVFVVSEARGPCFSHSMSDHDRILS